MTQRRSNTPYIYDNTARDLQVRRQMEEPRRQLSHETRKNREKARHMSIGYVTFLMVALVACAFFLVNYIQMQSQLTTKNTVALPVISTWKRLRGLPSANWE